MRRIEVILVLSVIFLLYAFVGTLDRQHEIEATERYCQSVKDGTYPDYLKMYKTECLTPTPERN